MRWHIGAPPVADDGSPVLVVLHGDAVQFCEYHGLPLVVSRWAEKLKTTLDPVRLSYDDVACWCEIPKGWR